jgi:large subunit ribosomal protein L29
MKTKEIRQLTEADLKLRIDETRKQIVENRLNRASNKLTNVASMRTARKTLARLLTIEGEERIKAGKG